MRRVWSDLVIRGMPAPNVEAGVEPRSLEADDIQRQILEWLGLVRFMIQGIGNMHCNQGAETIDGTCGWFLVVEHRLNQRGRKAPKLQKTGADLGMRSAKVGIFQFA